MKEIAKHRIEELTQSELFQRVSSICAAVNAVRDGKELLEISLEQILELFGAQRGSIFIVREKSQDLVLKASRGSNVGEMKSMVKRVGEGIVGKVAASKKPIVVEDIARDERFKDMEARGSYRTASFICAPLLIKDTLIGVINITDKGSGSRFTAEELQLLDFLSSQIALNYRRIELYKKFKVILKESKSLKQELGKSSQETSHLKRQVVLQEKLASIGKLAGGIAHEFNNPLDGVMRYTNLCLEQVGEDDVVREYLMEIRRGLNRMANIVRSLLACSRSSQPPKEKIDPNAAVEQAIQALQADIFQKKITLEQSLSADLPKMYDLGLERVASNLVRNAVDAVKEGGRVRVATFKKGYDLILEISDDGCGIPSDAVESIFEPFYTTKDIDKGCGLGLTIVSEIVKSYEGQISVESEMDKGTTFSIRIPLKETHEH